MDMNIQKFMAFVRTVEYGSFTKAAEILNYSQSGISRMINDLEKEWGVSLLERGRSGVRLTSDGLNYCLLLKACVMSIRSYRPKLKN
jgi:DNA-binding transcriptional LysR family regulator